MWAWLRDMLFHQPVHTLYFFGPTELGFWGGAQPSDICYSLTNTPSIFWEQHQDQCDQLCTQKFHAFYTVIMFGLYVFLLAKFLDALVFHACFARPVLRQLHTATTTRTKARITQTVHQHTQHTGGD